MVEGLVVDLGVIILVKVVESNEEIEGIYFVRDVVRVVMEDCWEWWERGLEQVVV